MSFSSYKEELVNICLKIYNEQLVIGTWGNFSIRVAPDTFVITPSGMDYTTLQPDDMVVLDLSGAVIEGVRKPSIEYNLHLELYKARKDINGICHTHSDYTKSFSVTRKPIPPVSEDLVQMVGGGVDVAPYFLPGTPELAKGCAGAIGDRMAVLLANHGLVTVGKDIHEAVKVAVVVERNAKTILFSHLVGQPVALSDDDVNSMRDFFLNKYGQK